MLSWLYAVKTNPPMTTMSTVHVVACKYFLPILYVCCIQNNTDAFCV